MPLILVSQHPIVHASFLVLIIWQKAEGDDAWTIPYESVIDRALDYMIATHVLCLLCHFALRYYEVNRTQKKKASDLD